MRPFDISVLKCEQESCDVVQRRPPGVNVSASGSQTRPQTRWSSFDAPKMQDYVIIIC